MFLQVFNTRLSTAAVISRRGFSIVAAEKGIRKVKVADEHEFQQAKPYETIPGPKALPGISIIHHFLPGGKLYNLGVIEQHKTLRDEYGDIVRLKGAFGKPDFIFLFNPKDLELVFRTEGQWPYRRSLEILDEFRKVERADLFDGIGGLLQDQGAVWQDTRTKVNPVMMQPKTVKSYVPTVQTIADEFVERIRKLRDEKLEVPADFSNELNKWALESISYIALDQRLNLLTSTDKDSDGQRLITAVHQFFDLSFELEMLPSIWKLYKTKKYKQLVAALHTMTNIITSFIDKSVEELKEKPNTSREESVLEKLLKIDRRVAIIMALDMLMAGVDTTSTAASGLLYQLATNPEKQEILRMEILEKLPNKDSQLTAQGMTNLPYLRACMKESNRLKPVAIGTARKTTQNLVICGYQLPKGIDVVMSQMLMSSDDTYFGRNTEFVPERFLKSNNKDPELKGENPFAFLPFGFGPRMCIGRRFAELELETLVAKILRNYRIEWHYPELKYSSKMLYMPSGEMKFRFVDI